MGVISRDATNRSSAPDVVDLARELLGAAPKDRGFCSRSPRSAVDRVEVDAVLLTTAAGVLTQLRVLGEVGRHTDGLDRIVVDILTTAQTHAIAPIGAIGVTCMLADLLRQPDEVEIATTLVRARNAFSDNELLDGAAAMCAATSWHLGDRLDIDPLVVIEEVFSAGPQQVPTRSRCRDHRPLT